MSRCVLGTASDLIRALVNHLEAHVLEHRDALGKWDRPVVAPYLQSNAVACVADAPMKVDAEGAARREPFDDPNIGERRGGRIVLPISLREGVAVTLEQRAGPKRIVAARQFVAELVSPGAHDRFDCALEARAIRIRRLSARKKADEVDANELSLREERVERAHAALVGVGKIIADRLAHGAAVALARNIDQDGDEAIEAVAPRQYPHARSLVELQHSQRELVKRILIELKQFVARVIFE